MPVDIYNIGPFHSARMCPATRLAGDIRAAHRYRAAYNFYGNVLGRGAAAGAPVVLLDSHAALSTPMQLRVQRLMCRAATCVVRTPCATGATATTPIALP